MEFSIKDNNQSFVNEQELFTAIDNLHDAFSVLEAVNDEKGNLFDLKFLFVNKTGAKDIGLPQNEIIGNEYLKIMPALKDSEIHNAYLDSLKSGKPCSFESEFVNAEMEDRNIYGYFDIKGTPFGNKLYLTWRNVTEQRNSEKKLHEEKWKIEQVLKISNELSEANLDMSAIINLVVKRMTELLGSASGITLISGDDKKLKSAGFYALNEDDQNKIEIYIQKNEIFFSRGLYEKVISEKKTVLIPKLDTSDPDSIKKPEARKLLNNLNINSLMIIPMSFNDEVIGTFTIGRNNALSGFNEDDLKFAKMILNKATLAILNSKLYNERLNDIEERKKAETELRQSEERFKTAIKNSPLPKVIYSSDGNYLAINDAWLKTTGYDYEDIPNVSKWLEKAYGEKKQEVQNIVDEVFKLKESKYLGEFTINAKDGRKLIWEMIATPLGKLPDGRPLNMTVAIDLTEKKKAEAELLRQKNLFETVISNLPVGVWFTDKKGIIINSNKAGKEIWAGERYCGIENYHEYKGWWADSGEPLKSEEWGLARAVQKGEHSFNEIINIECFDGSKKTIMNSSIPITEDGKIIGAIAVNQDITKIAEAEREIKLWQKRLESAAEHFDFNFVIYDNQRRFIYLNPSSLKMGKLKKDELLGKRDEEIFPKESYNMYLPAMLKSLETRSSQTIEISFDGNNGKTYLIVTFIPIYDQYGQLFQIVSLGHNVTDLRIAEQKLKESEKLYRATFEQAAVGIARVGLDGKWLEFNHKLCEITGYAHEELSELTFQDITHKDDIEKDLFLAKKLLAGEIKTYTMEKRYVKKDGSYVWANLTGSLVKKETGEPGFFIAVVQDISDKKRAEKILLETLDALEKSNKELEQYAYIASHDLQEPLRIINNYTQLLARKYNDLLDEQGLSFMGYITENTNRMKDLIQDLLELSRISGNKSQITKVDLNQTLKKVLENLKVPISDSKAEIFLDDLPQVKGDAAQIRQLFQNLINNALKFNDKKPPKIFVKVNTENGKPVFSVKDNGIGIDRKYFDKLFVMFQRLHLKNEYPGTGIGLTICRKVVENHDGKIWVESEPGKGSEFFFTLNS